MNALTVESKKWYLSKTILVQILGGLGLAVGAFVPSVGEFIQSYFTELGSGWLFVNTILRLITKKEIV
jgi:hypothetical protein